MSEVGKPPSLLAKTFGVAYGCEFLVTGDA
jgi:hypothetical protein